jgi:hypothetical protein
LSGGKKDEKDKPNCHPDNNFKKTSKSSTSFYIEDTRKREELEERYTGFGLIFRFSYIFELEPTSRPLLAYEEANLAAERGNKTIISLRRGEFGNRPLIAYEEANLAAERGNKTIISLRRGEFGNRPLIAYEEANLAAERGNKTIISLRRGEFGN